MIAPYCFLERPRELFAAACARGWLAAIRDFPRLMSQEACNVVAQDIPNELRERVCCIGEQNYAYLQLVIYAWVNGYMGFGRCTERQIVMWVSLFADVPDDSEALRHLIPVFAIDEAVEEVYAHFPDFQAQAS